MAVTYTPWHAHVDELIEFGQVLAKINDWSADEIFYFFEKPHKWDPEHELWVKAGKPTNDSPPAEWNRFVDMLDF